MLGNVAVNEEILFDMTLTSGDEILGASNVSFIDAVINPIPEPSMALLMSLGFAELSWRWVVA